MDAKKVGALFLALAVVVGGVWFFKSKTTTSSQVLRVYTWSNYFPDEILARFTQKTGVKVELTYMSSNEEMFAKLRAGASGFDVIQPSDYMVRRLAELSMIQPLDHRRLPHLSHLDDYYRNLPYDPGLRHSVPFTWGTTGIAVNTAKVKVPADGVSWRLLLESPDPGHTSLLDDMREVFAAVLKFRGLSINTGDKKELEAAKQDIGRVKNRILTFSSEPRPLLLREELTVAHVFSVDAIQAHAEKPAVRYFIPKEGGTIWTDNFSIPVSSRNVEGAHAFIDFFLEPDNALEIARSNLLATPNRSARERLPAEQRANPNLYPPAEVLGRMQFLEDLGDLMPVINRMWTELKT